MAKQAKTLSANEIRRALDYIATRKHAERNRVMLITMLMAGLRVGEVAALRFGDIVDGDGKVKGEVLLKPEQTKGKHARTVFFNDKLRKELQHYINTLQGFASADKLFYSQKGIEGFTANTLCQHFHYLFKNCGIKGASSHSPRRTFITNLANKGVGVRVLQTLAGHRSIATTQRYIDVNDDLLRKAVELV